LASPSGGRPPDGPIGSLVQDSFEHVKPIASLIDLFTAAVAGAWTAGCTLLPTTMQEAALESEPLLA
jgi:hypothetical protein